MGERRVGGLELVVNRAQAPASEGAGQQQPNVVNIFTSGRGENRGSIVPTHFRVDPLNQNPGDADWFRKRAKNGSSPDTLTSTQQVEYQLIPEGFPHVAIALMQSAAAEDHSPSSDFAQAA